ncbi:helix-turn-helix domain-containing protein [bacterium]|nr:helix-turn-helix domain-containing protein [bacterium]
MSDFNDFVIEQLKNEEFQKEYINESLSQYIQDGDFNAFFRSLEAVIKSRDSISGFCKKAGIDRALLYDIFNGNRIPKLDTLAKILKTLGLNLKVA